MARLSRHCRSCTAVKLALPLLVAMAILGVAAAHQPVLTKQPKAGRGRFLSSFDKPSPIGRRLLNFNFCAGFGTANNCAGYLPFAKNPQCCTDPITQIKTCWDVGSGLWDKCGSCTTKCAWNEVCCSGVCVNLLNDQSNCGFCGHQCPSTANECFNGLCGYNGIIVFG